MCIRDSSVAGESEGAVSGESEVAVEEASSNAKSASEDKIANGRDVPIVGFTDNENPMNFLTDVRVIEGTVYVLDSANAMSLLGVGDSMRIRFKKDHGKQREALKEPVAQSMKQPLGEILKKADPESEHAPAAASIVASVVAQNPVQAEVLKKAQVVPEVASAPEACVLKSASPSVTQHAKRGDRYGTLKNPGKDVFVKSSGGEWKSATDGMVILPGDEVKTAENNSVDVLMDGGKIGRVEIKEGSLFRIQKAETDPVTGDRATILNLALGKILVKVESLKGNSKFEVRTPTALTGVRGTLFEVTVKEKA